MVADGTVIRAEIGGSALYEAEVSQDLRQVPVVHHCLVLVPGPRALAAFRQLEPTLAAEMAAGGRPWPASCWAPTVWARPPLPPVIVVENC